MTALVSFERVFEVLDLVPLITEKPGAAAGPRRPGVRRVRRRALQLPQRPTRCRWPRWRRWPRSTPGAAPRCSTACRSGSSRASMVALVGTSGSGKSTIASLVPRLYDVDAGAVRLGGIDVRDLSFDAIRSTLGLVTQDGHLFHDTVRENLRFARPEATRRRAVGGAAHGPPGAAGRVAARRARHRGRRAGLPLLRRRAPAAHHRPAPAGPAPGRHPRRGHRPPRLHLRGRRPGRPGRRPGGPDRRSSSPTACPPSGTPTLILVIEAGRVVERGTHAELLAAGGRYAELLPDPVRGLAGRERGLNGPCTSRTPRRRYVGVNHLGRCCP